MASADTGAPRFDFDPEALKRRYREERDKRLRPGGLSQYVPLAGELAGFAADPNADPQFTREARHEDVDVVILGGGITGLMTGAALRKAGVDSVRMIDKAADFGGTWYWNRYPGIRCDVESYIYLPLLEDLGYVPTEKYAKGSEILAHCQAVARHFDLYRAALFQTEVSGVAWDEARSRWTVRTDRGDVLQARFVALSTGPLSKPKLPGIPGVLTFEGKQFHTARWDYAYTGGSSDGGLDGLADKRVAIIGTGATGVQVIPHLARSAKRLFVVQRTPSAVDVRDNRPTDPEWAKSLQPGWQKRRMENFSAILNGMPVEEDLVADRWTDVWGRLTKWANADPSLAAAAASGELLQMADYQKMEELRARIDDIVEDAETARKLKPWYNLFCKRPLYSDEYFQAFNSPNVTLVDTEGTSVERITPKGFVVNGTEYEVDCIVYASGYDIAVPTYKAGAYELTGRGGVRLEDKWAGGVRSLHGMYTDGFPNMFVMGGIRQAAASVNFPHILGMQAEHAAHVIADCLARGVKSFEVTPDAVQAWWDLLAANAMDRAQFEADCTPGYLNNEGDASAGPSVFANTFGQGIFAYEKIVLDWRQGGLDRDARTEREG